MTDAAAKLFRNIWEVPTGDPQGTFSDTDLEDILYNGHLGFLDAATMACVLRGDVYTGPSTWGLRLWTFTARNGLQLTSKSQPGAPYPYGRDQNSLDFDYEWVTGMCVREGMYVAGVSFYARFTEDNYFDGHDHHPLYLCGMKADEYGSIHHMADCDTAIRAATGNQTDLLQFGQGYWLPSPDGHVYYVIGFAFGADALHGSDPGVSSGFATFKWRVDGINTFTQVNFQIAPLPAGVGPSPFSATLAPDGRIAINTSEYYTAYGYISADLTTVTLYGSAPVSFSHTGFTMTGDGYFMIQLNDSDPLNFYDPEWQLTRQYPVTDLDYFGGGPSAQLNAPVGRSFTLVSLVVETVYGSSYPMKLISYNNDSRIISDFTDDNLGPTLFQVVFNTAGDRMFVVSENVISMFAVYDKSLPGVWTAVSPDDGSSWRNNARVASRPAGTTRLADGTEEDSEYHVYTMAAVRTPTALTLVGSVHGGNIRTASTSSDADPYTSPSTDSGSRNSLIIANYQGSAATGKEQGVVFKRTKPNLI